MLRSCKGTAWLIAAATILPTAATARGDELGAKLAKELATVKSSLFDRMGVSKVAVGDFTAAANLSASGGAGIGNAVADALKTLGMEVDKESPYEITGRYSRGTEPRSGLTSLRIQFKVVQNNDDLAQFLVQVVDAGTIMRLAGGTGDIAGETRKEQSKKVDDALSRPKPDLRDGAGANTRIASDPASPYAIEVLVKRGEGDYLPRAGIDKQGLVFVPLKIDDVYAVRLINDSDQPAGVTLTIDGLNMFAFADLEADRTSRLVVPSKKSVMLIGWYRNDGPKKGSNEFLVARRGEAAALKQLPESSAKVGMITATFAIAWPEGEAPPAAESKDDAPGTAIGKEIDQPFTRVRFDVGRPRNAVTVRYNKAAEPANLPQ